MLNRLILLGSLVVATPVALADSTRVGAFTIQHNAFMSGTLTPEIARSYGIRGGRNSAVLNVSVIKDGPGPAGTPVPALVDVELLEDDRPKGRLPMREVQSQGAVSYLGEFPVTDGQDLGFEIRVRPAGAPETATVRMRQEFFVD